MQPARAASDIRAQDFPCTGLDDRAMLDGLFRSDVIGLTIFDIGSLRTIRANDYMLRLIGATRSEFQAGTRCCYSATPPEWRFADDDAVVQAKEHGSWTPFEKEYERPDGSRVPVRVSSAPLHGNRGLVAVCVEDLSERRRTDDRLQLLQSEVNHLSRLSSMGATASILAHEVAQPILGVMNAITALEAARIAGLPMSDDRVGHALALAQRQAQRAGKLLKRTRRHAAPDRGSFKVVRLKELVDEAAQLALVRSPNIQLHLMLCGKGKLVRVDEIQIEQVLANIIRNAAEAMGGEGVITVSSKVAGDRVEVAVEDTGPGFGSGAESAFEAFYTTKETGTGLGLAICRQIVERHSGSIIAENGVYGGRVVFTLPRA